MQNKAKKRNYKHLCHGHVVNYNGGSQSKLRLIENYNGKKVITACNYYDEIQIYLLKKSVKKSTIRLRNRIVIRVGMYVLYIKVEEEYNFNQIIKKQQQQMYLKIKMK